MDINENNYGSEDELEDQNEVIDETVSNLDPNEWMKIDQEKYEHSINNVCSCSTNLDLYEREPYEIFEQILTNEFYEIIVRETNNYYDQFRKDNPEFDHQKTHNKTKQFQYMNTDKMKSFIGILYLMGINTRNSLEDHLVQ